MQGTNITMRIRSVARRAVLAVPPVRRLWNFAMTEGQRAADLEKRIEVLTERIEADAATGWMIADFEKRIEVLTERADTLMGELTTVSDERDALEVQLYVLRADNQRALARADATRQEMGELRAMLATAEAKLRSGEPANAELLYARLAEQLTQGFGALEEQLRRSLGSQGIPNSTEPRVRLYLDLLEKAVTGQWLLTDPIGASAVGWDKPVQHLSRGSSGRDQTGLRITHPRQIRVLAERILEAGVPGDFVAAGVFRGEAGILMRGVLAAYHISDRAVWVADAFAGSLELYGLPRDQVKLLKGTSGGARHAAPIGKVALLHLDGAAQSSRLQALEALYPKLSPGGFVIVDDASAPNNRAFVVDFRERNKITDPLEDIDGTGVFWRKSG
jgi:hypothetical protein